MAITTPFITDADVQKFRPDILDFGITSFTDQYTMASDDVYERLYNEWWPNAISRRYGLSRNRLDIVWPVLPKMDLNYLDTSALIPITCFRALSHYIFPMLATNSTQTDFFSGMADIYRRFYDEEWIKVQRLPIYDFDKDGQFRDVERTGPIHRRVVRA